MENYSIMFAFPCKSGFYKTCKFIQVKKRHGDYSSILEHTEAWRLFREKWSGFKVTSQPKLVDVKIHEPEYCYINVGTSRGNFQNLRVNKLYDDIMLSDIKEALRIRLKDVAGDDGERFVLDLQVYGWCLKEKF